MAVDLPAALREHLTKHGHAFHARVIDEIRRLHIEHRTVWRPEVYEFPAQVQGRDTRIDCILTAPERDDRFWVLAECKRMDPALKDWCFYRMPFIREGHRERYVAELVETSAKAPFDAKPGDLFIGVPPYLAARAVDLKKFHPDDPYYHLGVEIKGDERGDGTGSGRSAIEGAVGQVLIGANGLVETMRIYNQLAGERGRVLIPVIFTTANLWGSSVDLRQTELASGKIDSMPDLKPLKHLFLQYHQSPGLMHGAPSPTVNHLSEALAQNSIRTIAIVNVEGIARFLDEMDPISLKPEPS
jgi:hypothetical protein